MRKFSLGFVLMALLWACAPSGGIRTFRASTSKEVDLGKIMEIDGPVTFRLLLKNEYKDTLYPVRMHTPCYCTKVRFEKDPVAPGEDEVLEVVYDPAYRPGPMMEQIQVYYTNNSPTRVRIVTFKGEIIGYNHPIEEDRPYAFGSGLYMSHKVLSFGIVRPGDTADMFFRYGNGNTKASTVEFDIPQEWKPFFRLRQPGKMKADGRDTLHARFTMPMGMDSVLFAVRPMVDGKPVEQDLTIRAYAN